MKPIWISDEEGIVCSECGKDIYYCRCEENYRGNDIPPLDPGAEPNSALFIFSMVRQDHYPSANLSNHPEPAEGACPEPRRKG